MFDKTISLFCNSGDKWYPVVIHGCEFTTNKGYLMRQYGADFSDGASIHIGYTMDGANKDIAGKIYLQPKEWLALSDSAKAGALTLKGGNTFDFMWLGDYSEIDSTLAVITDDNYPKGFFDYMKKSKDNVYAVSNVSEYTLIKHIEVACR